VDDRNIRSADPCAAIWSGDLGQQFSTVSLIAKEIDRSILERLSIAESLAGSLSADTLASPPRHKP
jgi:hypothetical protein